MDRRQKGKVVAVRMPLKLCVRASCGVHHLMSLLAESQSLFETCVYTARLYFSRH